MRSRRPRARTLARLSRALHPPSPGHTPTQRHRPVPARPPRSREGASPGRMHHVIRPRNPHTRALGKGDIPEPGISAVARDTQLCREQPSAARSPTAPGTVELAATEGCLQPPGGCRLLKPKSLKGSAAAALPNKRPENTDSSGMRLSLPRVC